MAAFTVSVDRKFHDAFFAGRTGADSYTLSSGVTLTVDGDVRYGPNTTATTGAIGTVTPSAGARLFLDARAVRLIPFNSGSGTVPITDTVIFQAGTGGKLLGVYTSINTPPLAAGSAMPSTGFIKIREQAGPRFSVGPIFNIGASATGPDVQGWIEVAFAGTTFVFNDGFTFETAGDSFILPGADGNPLLTNGTRGQVLPLPGSVAGTFIVGCWIETGPGTGIYEPWASYQDLVDSALPTDRRARGVWCDATTRTIRLGSDGTNNVGELPPAGCRIKVPSVIVTTTNATVGYGANTNAWNNLTTSSFPWLRGGMSGVKLRHCAFSGQIQEIVENANDIFEDSTICGQLVESRTNGSVTMSRVICAPPGIAYPGANYVYANLFTCFGSSNTITDSVFLCPNSTSGMYTVTIGAAKARLERVEARQYANLRSAGIGCVGGDFELIDCIGVGAGVTQRDGQAERIYCKNFKFSSTVKGTVPATGGEAVFKSVYSMRCFEIDGLSWLIDTANTCHVPSNQTLIQGTPKYVRNIGTPTNPLNVGTVNPTLGLVQANGQSSDSTIFHEIWTTAFSNATQPWRNGMSAAIQRIIHCGVNGNSPAVGGSSRSYIRGLRSANTPTYAYRSGLVWGDVFLSDTTGELLMALAPPPSPDGQVAVTGGSPVFVSASALQMRVVGSQITWICPYRVKGHSFPTVTLNGVTATNFLLEFDVDTGSGFTGWRTWNTTNANAVTVDRAVGYILKVRLTCTTANTQTITKITLATTTTLAEQRAVSYPFSESTVSVTNLVTSSLVKATRVDTGAVLFTGQESGGSVSFTTDYTGQIAIEARKASGAPYYQPWTALATVTGDISITALQVRDDQ